MPPKKTNKRGRPQGVKRRKQARTEDRNDGGHSNEITNESQSPERVERTENNNRRGRSHRNFVREEFVEGDDQVEFEAEGQSTEFGEDDNEYGQGQMSADSVNRESGTETSSDDGEVTLSQWSTNNNATLDENRRSQREGTLHSSGSSNRYRDEMDFHRRKDQDELEVKFNTSLDNMQKYVDEKLANVSKLAEIERELERKKKELRDLKAKGKKSTNCINQPLLVSLSDMNLHQDDETESEMTIYRNAVEKAKSQRHSSSSDELLNVSDETDKVLPMKRYFSERELSRERERSGDYRRSRSRDHSYGESSRNRGHSRDRRFSPEPAHHSDHG